MHLVCDARCLHPTMGGIGHATRHLLDHLGPLRSATDSLSILVGAQPPPGYSVPNGTLVQVDAGMIDERFEQFHLPHMLEQIGGDVYLNMTFSLPAIPGRYAQVAVIHDVVFEERPDLVEPGLCQYLQRWSRFAANVADRVVTVSDDACRRIQRIYHVPDSRILSIPNGMGPVVRSEPDSTSVQTILQRLQIRAPYLLYVGSIETKKGLLPLLEAFEHRDLDDHYRSLILAGGTGGDDQVIDARIQRHRRAADIRRLGYIAEDEKQALLAGARTFVYPSLYEGFGLPPLEALAHGIPCVVHDDTSLPEVVGACGVQVNVLDISSFVAALKRANQDEPWRRHVQNDGPLHAQRFRWSSAAAAYWNVCQDALAAHRATETS